MIIGLGFYNRDSSGCCLYKILKCGVIPTYSEFQKVTQPLPLTVFLEVGRDKVPRESGRESHRRLLPVGFQHWGEIQTIPPEKVFHHHFHLFFKKTSFVFEQFWQPFIPGSRVELLTPQNGILIILRKSSDWKTSCPIWRQMGWLVYLSALAYLFQKRNIMP